MPRASRPARRSTTFLPASGAARAVGRATPRSGQETCEQIDGHVQLTRIVHRRPTYRRAGHAECGDRGQWGAGGVGDVAFDQPGLVDVRERQVRGGGQYADGAGGDSAVAGVDVTRRDRAGSAPVSTRHSVVFDGDRAGRA